MRSALVLWPKLSKARRAAVTARSTSAAEPSATSPICVFVAGFMIGNGVAESGLTQAPSM